MADPCGRKLRVIPDTATQTQRPPFCSECCAAPRFLAQVASTEIRMPHFPDACWNAMKAFPSRWLLLLHLCGYMRFQTVLKSPAADH